MSVLAQPFETKVFKEAFMACKRIPGHLIGFQGVSEAFQGIMENQESSGLAPKTSPGAFIKHHRVP